MVVDRKTKDMDASIELLEDRKKTTNYINYGIMGLFITLSLAYIWLFFLSLDIFEKNILQSLWYYYLKNPVKLKEIKIEDLSESELFSLKGYTSDNLNKKEYEQLTNLISRPPIKGIDFSTNIFRFLGIYLLKKNELLTRLNEKFESSDAKIKYVISRVENKFIQPFKEYLDKNQKSDQIYIPIFKFIFLTDH